MSLVQEPSPSPAGTLIEAAEATRVTSTVAADYEKLIQQMDELIGQNWQETSQQKLIELLQAIRLKVTTQMQLGSLSWKLSDHVGRMVDTREGLEQFHLNEEFQDKLAMKPEEGSIELTNFAIEFARDVAKYLDKLGRLTGDKEFHTLAAQVLLEVTRERELVMTPQNKITPQHEDEAYFLAHFERLIQLDLAGTEVDPEEVLVYTLYLAEQDLKEGSIQNWDRQAAIGWWLFEFGVRHKLTDLMKLGLSRVNLATDASKGKKTKMGYIATRLVANAFEMSRRAQFVLSSPDRQAEIKQQLALPKTVKE